MTLVKCQVKNAWQSDGVEVLRKNSHVQRSPKNFKVTNLASIHPGAITLKQLPQTNTYDKVMLTAKVVRVEQAAKVAGGKTKQDVIVDAHCSARLTLWERDTDKLEVDTSYHFTNVVLNCYNNVKCLSFPRKGASFIKADDIGDPCAGPPCEQWGQQ